MATRTVAGLPLSVVEAGAYQYEADGIDYAIQREGREWVLDAFNSNVKDDHDAAHIGGGTYPTLREAAEATRDFTFPHRPSRIPQETNR